MNEVKSLIAGLVKEPGLLSNLVKDPQSILRVAQLAGPDQKAGQVVGQMVSNLTKRFAAPPSAQAVAGDSSRGSQSVALTGVVALAAVAGGVTVVGVVSLVALSAHPEGSPS